MDGHDIRSLQPLWFRQQVAVVSQEPVLFPRSILANIAYGCAREPDMSDVVSAAAAAQCLDFIGALPRGFHTVVDTDRLSGGQKQRIAIARAILQRPRLLLLDEATSSLDPSTSRKVQVALHALMSGGCSTLIITHSIAMAMRADFVYVMDAGQIVESGIPSDLEMKHDSAFTRSFGSGRNEAHAAANGGDMAESSSGTHSRGEASDTPRALSIFSSGAATTATGGENEHRKDEHGNEVTRAQSLAPPLDDWIDLSDPMFSYYAHMIQSVFRVHKAKRDCKERIKEIYSKSLDPTYNCYYYYNDLTGESSWIKPKLLGEDDLPYFWNFGESGFS
jgi:ABC-type polar amino acid transport system ATPase subunit